MCQEFNCTVNTGYRFPFSGHDETVMNFSQIKAEQHYEESHHQDEAGATDMHEPAVHWLEGFLEWVTACQGEIQSFI